MRITPITNYTFGTQHLDKKEENYGAKDTPYLNHTTAFFRYGDIDELIVDLLKKKNSPINIVSAGCSYGEEVYSYAMALENANCRSNIVGIDISNETIKEARLGAYMLDNSEVKLLEEDGNLGFNRPRSEFEKEMKKCFHEHFSLIDAKTHQYVKKEGTFNNCSFEQLNVLTLKNRFEKNSQDAILCRYLLYHLKKDDLVSFFLQAYETLKPEGLFCIEPFGYYHYQSILTDIGFEQPYKEAPCIFRKPKKNISGYFKQKIIKPFVGNLNNKSDFNNVQQSFEENLFVHL